MGPVGSAMRRTVLGAALATLAVLILVAPTGPAVAENPLDSIVGVRASIPADARSVRFLGAQREGSGVVIDGGRHVLTIGYLILEADSVEIVLAEGRVVAATVTAYDYDSGFGLVHPLAPLGIAAIELGRSADLGPDTEVMIAGTGGPAAARVVSRREFAGYWEYLLEDAIFTAPPVRAFAGAALIGSDGKLLGVGSLMVGDAAGAGHPVRGNMFVPIDALTPILEQLIREGRAASTRPWLGIFSREIRGHLFVDSVSEGGPAEAAGIETDDVIVALGGAPVGDLADFYRKLWALGGPGVVVPLSVLKRDGLHEIRVRSADRYDYLRLDGGT